MDATRAGTGRANLDERADVFALGSILCEILPASRRSRAKVGAELYRKAERADLSDALARLDSCGADAEWWPWPVVSPPGEASAETPE